MRKLRIQFVGANAVKRAELRIEEEFREIKNKLARKGVRRPVLEISPAARIGDVIQDLTLNSPDIVHFSGHGSPLGEIILFNEAGEAEALPRRAFEQLFRTLKGKIRLVVLNACYSEVQAKEISELIDCVIGVSETIPDKTALQYSAQLYDALADGASVKKAHELALILAFAGRLTSTESPRLIHRPEITPDQVFFSKNPGTAQEKIQQKINRETGKWKKEKQLYYDQARDRYGVWAQSMSVVKVCNDDGSSVLDFELKGLTVLSGELRGLHFSLESTAGVVSAPILDPLARQLSIRWEADEVAPSQTMDGMIDSVRIVHGTFQFDQPIRPRGDAYTFGWKVRILNSDALTAWEFHNLYPSDKLYHVNGVKLDEPKEYFARLVWFPVGHLSMRVELPAHLDSRIRLRYFDLKNRPQIPLDEIVSDRVLRSLPRGDSPWYGANGNWEANIGTETMESRQMSNEPAASVLAVDAPILGSYYSLDWTLPDRPVRPEFERIIREADVVRGALLEHRKRRLMGTSNEVSAKITELFRELHKDVITKYRSGVDEESFETTLMTYDKSLHRLVMVEGLLNDGEMAKSSWDFWLPFGLGLAGACFRSGGTFRYRRELDAHNPEKPEHYLPVPGAEPHEFLLTFPVDHPELSEEMTIGKNVQRYRQLIGVLTVGSTYRASSLFPLCNDDLLESKFLELKGLRDDCQEFCDLISSAVLNKTPQGKGSL